MRKLATVRKIDNISSIPDADLIEVATVGGWKIVTKKNEFQIGDLVVYLEIDSWVPTELAPFLSKGNEPREFNGVKGERLRTVKLRGQISQGLLLPRHVALDKIGEIEVDMDVTELLGIQKWEAPISPQLAGSVRGNFPSIVPKTDQERIQNLTNEISTWQNMLFEITEKLDGSSCTYFLDTEFHVCSRNLDLKRNYDNTFWKVAQHYDIETKMIEHGLINYAIQGELIGEGIQKNKYQIKGHNFYVFDIYDANTGKYLNAQERTQLCIKLGLLHCPVIGSMIVAGNTCDILLNLAEGKSVLNSKTEREGLVFKSYDNPDISFKAISNKFLIKNEE